MEDIKMKLINITNFKNNQSMQVTNKDNKLEITTLENIVLKPLEKIEVTFQFSTSAIRNLDLTINESNYITSISHLRLKNRSNLAYIDSSLQSISLTLENRFNIANLPYMLLGNPLLIKDINENYTKYRLGDYLLSLGLDLKTFKTNQYIPNHIAGEYIYLDVRQNPFGTVYIKAGTKICDILCIEYQKIPIKLTNQFYSF